MVKKTADFPWTTRVAGRMLFSSAVWQEIEHIDATGEAVLALASRLDDKPMICLINRPAPGSGAVAVDFGAFNVDPATRDFVRQLYPHAKRILADSSHQMQLTNPEIVTAAIREIAAASINPTP